MLVRAATVAYVITIATDRSCTGWYVSVTVCTAGICGHRTNSQELTMNA